MKKVLLTGAAGFIGFQTAKILLQEGYFVVGVDNLNDYYDVRLKEYRLKLISDPNFVFKKIDIENKSELEQLFEEYKFDSVINLAARAGVRYSMENPDIYMSTNAQGTLNILSLMQKHNVKKLVLASTSSLYAGQDMPFLENLPVNTPISPYAASKKAAEVMAYTFHYLYGLDVSVVRYFTVYGPAGRPDMSVFRFIRWIDEGKKIELFGDGSQSRDFTYVTDIAMGTVRALKNVGYEIINLGGGNNPISMNKVIEMIEQELGKKALISNKPFHIADVNSTWANIDKAKRLLDWSPQVGLEEGIKKSIQWYLENREFCLSVQL